MTPDTLHATCDAGLWVNNLSEFQLTAWERKGFEDWEKKDD